MTYRNWINSLAFCGYCCRGWLRRWRAIPSAGKVANMTGNNAAEARQPDGTARKLGVGDAVYSGEQITTDKATSVHFQFVDESSFSRGRIPNS